ncbi:MAG: TauD/TfdA dioxygenase family protein [Acidimicrobiales bacterium]
MGTSTLDVTPVTPRIGATVSGVDLRGRLSPDLIDELRAVWLQYQVLFFRDQDLTLDQHREFARAFGDLYTHPTIPGPDGFPEALRIHAHAKTKKAAGEGWHTDVSADAEPPSASILRLEEVPPCGGDTLFCSMYDAYDALSDHWKRFIDPLDARHNSAARHGGEFGLDIVEHPENVHPVVRTHPETGRKALYVNQGFTMSIEGMSKSESRATLDFLFTHCQDPAFHVRFDWEPNSMAMWDNRSVMHNAIFDYHPHTRRGYRFTVKGDRPAR